MAIYNNNDTDNKRNKDDRNNGKIIRESNNDLEITVSKNALFTEAPAQIVKQKPSEEERKIKRQQYIKKRKKNKISTVAITLLFTTVILLVLVVNLTQGKYENRVRTSYIKQGVIENKTNGIAYFLRSEYGIQSDFTGKLVPNVNEGERVAVGSVIAYVVSEGMEEDLNELKKIENRISAAQNSTGESAVLISEDLTVIDKEIERLTKILSMHSMKGNMTDYVGIKRELDALFEQRNDLTMNADTQDAYIKELQNQRNELNNKLKGKMHEVTANVAGVVSFYIDNASEFVTGIGTDNVTEKQLKNLDVKSEYMVGEKVSQGNMVARITPDIIYSVAVKVGDLKGFVEGATVTIKAKNRKYETKANIVSIDKESNIVVFETSYALASSISSRKMDVDVILEYQEGMKVPLRCLSSWDDAGITARIALVRANYIEFVYVNVLAKNDDYAIISSGTKFDDDTSIKVKYNDVFVINHENVTEGEVVK